MKLLYVWSGGILLVHCLIIVINGHLILNTPPDTVPWIVNIQRYDLLDEANTKYKFHCVGVLTGSNIVWTNSRCLDTFPKDSHMVLFAGNTRLKEYGDYVQNFLPFGAYSMLANQIISIPISPPMRQTTYTNYIKLCTELNCLFDGPDGYGYQYGFRLINSFTDDKRLYLTQYNFLNSSALCLESIGNDDNKYCTYHNCSLETGNMNVGGEVLTKIYKGQSYLMGFWDYDVCEKNIRVFQKIEQDTVPTRTRYRF